MTDKQETGVFIIWEKGRYLSVPILRDISTERTCLGAAIRKRNADAANF